MALNIGGVTGSLGLDVGPFQQGLQSAQSALRSSNGIMKGLAVAGGVAVAAALGASLAGAIQLEPARKKVAAQLGLTTKEAANVGKAASMAYKNGFGTDMGDATKLTGDIVSSFEGLAQKSDKEIAHVTGRIATISSTFDFEASQVAQIASQLVNTGMAGSIDEATDIMAKSFQKVPAAARDELADAYGEYSKHANDIGMSAEAFAGVMVKAAQEGGMGVDKAGDAIKEFSIRAVDGSKTTQGAFADLGLSSDKMAADIAAGGERGEEAFQTIATALLKVEDPVKRNAIGVALMGTAYEDLGSYQEEFVGTLAAGGKALGDHTDAVKVMGETISGGAAAQFERARRAVITFAVDAIGGYLLPAVTTAGKWIGDNMGPAIEKLVGWIKSAAEWTQKYSGWIIPLLGGLGTFVTILLAANAALKVHAAIQAIMAAGGFLKWITAIIKSTQIYTGVQAALNLVMAMNPILLVVAAIAALVVGLVIAYKNSETFRRIVDAAFQWVLKIGKEIGAFFSGPFVDFFRKGFDWIKNAASAVGDWFTGPFAGFFTGTYNAIKGAIQTFIDWHVNIWNTVRDFLTSLVQNLKDRVVAHFVGMSTALTNVVMAIANWLLARWDAIRTGVMDQATRLKDGAVALFDLLRNAVVGRVEALRSTVVSLVDNARTGVLDQINRLKSGAEGLFNNIITAARNIFNLLPDAIKDPIRTAVKWVNDNLIGKLNGLLGDLSISFRVPKIPGFHTGGRVGGAAPTDTADNVLARLTPGEQILNVRSTRKMDANYPGLLDHINKYGELPGYAGGGKAMPNNRTKPWPRYVAALVRQMFPGVGDIYGQGNRPIRTSYHHTGDALDFMVGRNKGLGDSISAWGTSNARALMLDQLIWYNRIQSPVNGKWRGYSHPFGSNPTLRHEDHPHFSFRRGARGMPELLGQKLTPEQVAAINAGGGGGFGFDFSAITDPLKDLLNKWDTSSTDPWGSIAKKAAMAIPEGIVTKVMEFLPSLGSSDSVETGEGAGDHGGGRVVEQWRGVVLKALQMLGLPSTDVERTLRRMNQESRGNPRAVNNWDSNAKRGTPSKGLMQVIDPTFRAYALAPHNKDIFNPLSNVLASMRYTIKRYGSLARGYDRKGGYALGTDNATAGWHAVGENGPELVMSPTMARFRGGETVVPLRPDMRTGGNTSTVYNITAPDPSAQQIILELKRKEALDRARTTALSGIRKGTR